jgi:hypothetical protein
MCKLFQKEVQYLGHITLLEGIATHPEWLTPTGKQELESFLGLCICYRWFITGFADTEKLLTIFTEEKQTFWWLPKMEAAFQSLNEAVCTAPVLGHPQPGEKFNAYLDMGNVGISGVLSQMKDGQERITAYYSTTLNRTKRKYCIARWELLAIVKTLVHFHKHLYGQEF